MGPILRRARRMGLLHFKRSRNLSFAPRLILIVFLAALAGCGENFDKDIETVRAATTLTDDSNEQLAQDLAGARGKVEWIGSRFAKYEDNEYIVGVTARIERYTRAGAKRLVELQFINNRQTQQVAFEQLLIDGRPQDLLGGALNLLLLQLE
jgi:hypothetical protein